MNIERVERVVTHVSPNSSIDSQLGTETKRYLREIVGRLNFPHERLASIVDATLALREAWVDRRLVSIASGATAPPPEDSEALGVPLDGVLRERTAQASASSIVSIVGPSGFGKSTALEMLAIREAGKLLDTGKGRIPIWLPAVAVLDEDVDLTSTDPMEALRSASPWIAAQNVDLVAELVELAAREDVSYLILVDAIDQLDFDSLGGALNEFSRFLSRLESQHPECLIILSSRDDIWFSDSCKSIRHRSTCFQLQSLSLADVASYIDSCERHSRVIDEEYAARLKSRIGAEPMLSNLLRRPLMLGLSMYIVEQNRDLPPGLGGICHELVTICLSEPFEIPKLGRELVFPILELAAWKSGERQRNSPLASLSAAELAECTRAVLSGTDRHSLKMASSTELLFVNMAHGGLGLFGELAPNEFGFADEAFRLYFAGSYLVRQSREVLMAAIDHRSECLELLVWAQKGAHTSDIDSVMVLIEDLYDQGELRFLLTAGELLSAIREPAQSMRRHWFDRWSPRIAASLDAVRSSATDSLPDRVRAGNALATIGDPILAGLPLGYPTVSVVGGVTHLGSLVPPETIGDKPKYEKIHWYPPYRATIDDYEIGVHPVTNYEYAMFMDAGGYEDLTLWRSPEARAWMEQDENTLRRLTPIVHDSLGLHYRKDIQAGFMSVVDYESMRDEFVRKLILRREPLHWHDQRFNRPNQPVVGVNLWEVKAYCVWLTQLMRSSGRIDSDTVCRLPSEEEWEYAAGPAGAIYPWGSDWDPDRCHMRRDAWIASAVSIGTFSWVPSYLGCQDMIGNVFDTTLSAADPYSGRPKPHSSTGMGEIITRGGSWLATAEAARSIRFRSWDPPCNAYADQSFRVVISKIDLP